MLHFWGVDNQMQRKELIRIRKTAAALACVVSLVTCSSAVSADDMDMIADGGSDSGYLDDGSYVDSGYNADDGASLFEDMGEDVQYNAGVPMDTLQDAMRLANALKTENKKYILLENDLPDNY